MSSLRLAVPMPSADSFIEAGRNPTAHGSTQHTRYWLLHLALGVALATLLGRSFYLQVWQGSTWRKVAEDNRIVAEIDPAPRGIIYDGYGQQLVANIASTDVLFDPVRLPATENESVLIERLPVLLDVDVEFIRQQLSRARASVRPTRLAQAITHDRVLEVEQALPELPGVYLGSALVRDYLHAEDVAHVLGFTSSVTVEELDANPDLLPIDYTGKTGLEATYEEVLRGSPGVNYQEINAAGRPQKQLEQHSSTPGINLYTTLDLSLQKFIIDQLRAAKDMDEQPIEGAAVVALDPRSGAIRALVSWPTYNPNLFSQPAEAKKANEIFTAPHQPLFNRPISGSYPPGSTIKPLIAAAALAEGIITPQTTVLSTGGITVGPWNFPDWRAGGHGLTDVTKAIAESVNTFFYVVTGGFEGTQGLGVRTTTDYLAKFSWGQPTGIDIPQEASGFLPSPEWKEKTKNEPWYIGDTYHLGIGQGDVLATPLQLAMATSAIANGGTLHQPFLVERQQDTTGVTNELSHTSKSLGFAPAIVATVKAAMRETVVGSAGSGRRLAQFPIALAGKTGTAQVGGDDRTHAWFTSFGPYENPELVLTILLEHGGDGDKVAVPLAERVWQWWLEHRYD